MDHALDEDWQLLLELFALGWEQVAVFSGAVERLRGFAAAGDLLRVLLLHVWRGSTSQRPSSMGIQTSCRSET
jgi:hypothetical protein